MKLNLRRSTAVMLAGVLSVSAAGAVDVQAKNVENVVIIGDSLSYGEGSYADLLADASSADVKNFSVEGGMTGDVLALLDKTEVQSALQNADVIVVNAGVHDIMDPFMAQAKEFMDEFGFQKFEDVFFASLEKHNMTETDLQLYYAQLTAAVKTNKDSAKANMLEIGDRLAVYNDADVILQTVYNPIDTIEKIDQLSEKRKFAYTSVCRVVNTTLKTSVNGAIDELALKYQYDVLNVHGAFLGNAYRYTYLNDLNSLPTAEGNALLSTMVNNMMTRGTGDVTGDGEINAQDAAAVLIYASEIGAGLESRMSKSARIVADVNGSKDVDAADAAKILIYAAEQGVGGKPSWD